MDKTSVSTALISAVNLLRFDNNLSDEERQRDQDTLLKLRQMIVDGLFEKARLVDQMGDIANISRDGEGTAHITFDGSQLTNLLGVYIELILGQRVSGNVSVEIK